jgi:hypothetical protein
VYPGRVPFTEWNAPSRDLIGKESTAVNRTEYSAADFAPGTLFAAPDFKINVNPRIDSEDNRLADTQFGPVLAKFRYWLCLTKFEDHMIALPLYTFNGRGVQAKPMRLQYQYCQLRDICDVEWEKQSFCGPLDFDSKELCGRFPLKSSASCVHLVSPTMFHYNDQVKVLGQLLPGSVVLLKQLFAHFMNLSLGLGPDESIKVEDLPLPGRESPDCSS